MDPDTAALTGIEVLLRKRQAAAAEQAARQFTAARPQRIEGYVLLGRSLQQRGDFGGAMRAVKAAPPTAAQHPAAVLLIIECLLQSGETAQGMAELRALERRAAGEPRLLQDVGGLYSQLNLHMDAERCYGMAAGLRPQDHRALYNWATCLIAIGKLDDAEQLFTQVIALAPFDYDAYYNRSTLRRQTAERNHVEELRRALSAPQVPPASRIALGYALAKELEDLGRHPESFAELRSAADARRRQLSYRVEEDIAAMNEITLRFGADYGGAGHADGRPIFIVGLPRSGTTLVDRILSSHSAVQSRGESSDMASIVMRLAFPASGKIDLIRRVAAVDPAAVGAAYCARLAPMLRSRSVDKTPLNFLYLGLIAAALPGAAIVHVRRSPLDVCYAMYKTLFRMAYPFSYDLTDLGRYYLAYADLMAHWRTVLGARLIEIDYEELVSDQRRATAAVLERCGLGWEDACLEFHRNPDPSLTASAAQVRQPIYSSSVGLWRRYGEELQPLAAVLRAGGVEVP